MAKLSTTSVFGDLLVDGMIHGNVTGNLTGNASTATSATTATSAGKWSTARTLTIGNTGKSVDGSGNQSWTLSEIGAFPSTGGTISGAINLPASATSTNVSHPTQLAYGLLGAYGTLKILGNTDQSNGPDNEFVHIAAGWGLSPAEDKGIKVHGTYATCFGGTIYTTTNKPTPADIGAAAASHGTHVTYSTTAPKVAGTAAVGSANNVARGDHVHPAQTSVSGNAGTATTLQTARTITIGNKGKSFNGSANVSWTLDEIGASDKYLMKNNYVRITIDGDANTYYPVLINYSRSAFPFAHLHISRSYSLTAPDTWNTSTHRGGLTLSIRWTGDSTWGGNCKDLIVDEFNETYATMVAGMKLCTAGLIVWLRGGGAIYQLDSDYGIGITYTINYTDYTDGNKTVFSPRTDVTQVDSEIKSKWVVRSTGVYDNNVRVYSSKNKPTPADIGAAASSHGTHVSLATATPKANGTAAVGTSSKQAREDHVHPLQTSVATLTTARTLTIGNTGKTFNGGANVSWSLAEIGAADLVQMGVNRILFERFGRGSITGNAAITESDLIGKPLLDSTLVDDFKSYGVGDTYLGRLTTHLYFSAATEWATTATSDDGSTIYLNDTVIATLSSCTATNVTLNFVKGWNKIVWIFHENAGADSCVFGSSIKSVANLVYMNAYPVASPKKVHQAYASDTATTANTLSTARTLTIGSTGKTFNGSANVSWTLAEIGAAASSHSHNSITYQDTRAVNTTAKDVPSGLSVHLKSNGTDGISDGGSYHPVLMMKPWNDKSGWPVGQLAVTQNNNLYFRVSSGADDTSWNAWKKVSLEGHTHSAGGTVTAVASDLTSVTINSYDSILSGINTNIGNL